MNTNAPSVGPWGPELAARLVSAGMPYTVVYDDVDDDLRMQLAEVHGEEVVIARDYRSPKCWQCNGPLLIDRIQRIVWSPFCEWWCVPVDMDETIMLEALRDYGGLPVCGDLELIRDRLYGGFKCRVSSNCRHIALDVGTYSFANPESNRLLPTALREETWERLILANGRKRPLIGGGPFCADAPAAPAKSKAA